MRTAADLVGARAGDDRPGLTFEGRTWSWGEVGYRTGDPAYRDDDGVSCFGAHEAELMAYGRAHLPGVTA